MTFSDSIEQQIKQISSERILSASQITELCSDCFKQFAKETNAETSPLFWEELYTLSKRLVSAQPDMAPIFTLSNTLLSGIREEVNLGHSVEQLKKSLCCLVDKAAERSKEAFSKLSVLGLSLIEEDDKILTHSYSSSVRDMLIKAHRAGKSFEVIATESRPGFEGQKLAEDLGRQGIVTTLVTEAASLGMMEHCKKVFMGADRVSEQFFINKVGTRGIALGAKAAGKDFYVVCDTNKFVPGRLGSFSHKQHPPEEVLEHRYPNVIVENPYFEAISLSLVTVVLCEEGLLPPGGVKDYLLENVHFPELLST